MADQHMAALLGSAGNPYVHTPNLDRLAASGVRFANAYAQNPICTPSRVSLLSGQYPHNHGYYGLSGPAPARLPNFLGHFRAQGYRTAAIGKLHLPDRPQNWIKDDVDFFGECYRTIDGRPGESIYFDYLARLGIRHLEDSRLLPETGGMSAHDARPSRMPFEHCVEMWIAQRANEFISQSHADGRPFCMEVSFPRPHHQLTPDQRFWDLYPENLPLPETLRADCSHRPPHFREMVDKLKENKWLFEPKEFEAGCRRVWRGYLACISQVDHAVGVVLDHLDSSGLSENTIVVYGADHGAYHGTFGVPEKAPGICSDAVCKVPFVWRIPALARVGVTSAALVENVDLAPTLTALAGLPAMETADGKDISRLIFGTADSCRSCAVTENPWSKSLRWGSWRMVHYQPETFPGQDVGELYHVDNDPNETDNLYHNPAHQSVVSEGRRMLLEWLVRTTRTVTVHPSIGDPAPGDHHYEIAGDGKETNRLGAGARARQGDLNYL